MSDTTNHSDRPGFESVRTMVEHGDAFYAAHVGTLGHTAATWGGLVMGLMRAIAECPNCPGVYRVALDEDWNQMVCPRCHGLWERKQ